MSGKEPTEEEQKSELYRKLLLEEIDILLKKHKEELTKKVHARLRKMAEVPE